MIATDVTLDQGTHVYTRGLQTLTSVSSVIRTVIPTDYSGVDPEVLENARLRGSECDALFSAYVEGRLDTIPAGTRKDVWNDEEPFDGLLQKLIPWWDKLGIKGARSQVILADDEVAGTCDILADQWLLDLKCVSKLQPTYGIQLGAYRELSGSFQLIGVIHVNKTMREPKLVKMPEYDCVDDWKAIRAAWKVIRRIGK